MTVSDLPVLSDLGFQSDGPKQKVSEDQLRVAAFIRRLIGPILSMPAAESLVVGIYGPWGYGKSTALNFLEEELFRARLPDVRRAAGHDGDASLPAPLIVRFTPWLYSDVDALLASFFETLAAALNENIPNPQTRKRFAIALRAIGEFVAPAAKLGVRVVVGPVAAIADRIIDVVGSGIQGVAKIIEGGEVAFAKRKEEASRILVNLAKGASPHRVVVMVDDLDRAAPAEILAMLKLVKLIADLPNITYVLAFDKDRVGNAVAEALQLTEREDFLDKIVQVGVVLPPFERNQLAKMIVSGAEASAKMARLETEPLRVEWSGWEMLLDQSYIGNVRRSVQTPRDVVRILNLYRFSLLTSRVNPEVHPVDLLLLCVIQVRYPRIHDAIRANRRFLLGDELKGVFDRALGPRGVENDPRSTRITFLKAILTGAGLSLDDASLAFLEASPAVRSIQRGAVAPEIEMVLELFPNCIEEQIGEVEAARARSECRIFSPEHFDGYFRLDQPIGVVRRSEIQQMYDSLLSEDLDVTRAELMLGSLSRLSSEERESLERGLADMARGLHVLDAKALFASLEKLAYVLQHGDQTTGIEQAILPGDTELPLSPPYSLFAALLLRAASVLRQHTDSTVRDDAVAGILRMISALPDDFGAQLANDFCHRPPVSLGLSDDERKRIADSGLPLAEKLVRRRYSAPAAVRLDGRQFSHDLWRWRRLAYLSGRCGVEDPWPPIMELVDELLRRDALIVAEIVALAAGWGDGPSLDMHSPQEVRKVIRQITSPDVLDSAVRSVIQSEQWRDTTWPHLLWQYMGEEPPLERKRK